MQDIREDAVRIDASCPDSLIWYRTYQATIETHLSDSQVKVLSVIISEFMHEGSRYTPLPRRLTCARLAAFLKRNPSSIYRSLDALEELGLVERRSAGNESGAKSWYPAGSALAFICEQTGKSPDEVLGDSETCPAGLWHRQGPRRARLSSRPMPPAAEEPAPSPADAAEDRGEEAGGSCHEQASIAEPDLGIEAPQDEAAGQDGPDTEASADEEVAFAKFKARNEEMRRAMFKAAGVEYRPPEHEVRLSDIKSRGLIVTPDGLEDGRGPEMLPLDPTGFPPILRMMCETSGRPLHESDRGSVIAAWNSCIRSGIMPESVMCGWLAYRKVISGPDFDPKYEKGVVRYLSEPAFMRQMFQKAQAAAKAQSPARFSRDNYDLRLQVMRLKAAEGQGSEVARVLGAYEAAWNRKGMQKALALGHKKLDMWFNIVTADKHGVEVDPEDVRHAVCIEMSWRRKVAELCPGIQPILCPELELEERGWGPFQEI